MKQFSEVAPGLLVIQIQIQAVCSSFSFWYDVDATFSHLTYKFDI